MPPKLGILAGTGALPRRLVEACQADRREVFVITFEGENENRDLPAVPGTRLPLGAVGRVLEALRQAGCREVVLAGAFRRPAWSALKPDWRGARLLPKVMAAGGDDAVLKVIAKEMESEGFRVIGADEVQPQLLAPVAAIAGRAATPAERSDIALGRAVLRALSPFDVGQAVVVEAGRVLGIEGPEGTDALIDRARNLKTAGPGTGVLVKMRKRGQDQRLDRPTVGPTTVESVAGAGFAGIAVEAGETLLVDQSALTARALALGVFVVGFDAERD
ncbi:MAG: LpxI family protein [Alphaproteobacteria bacterium]|nr:LpxI family protein [Alphaproteobacteria bacterium]